jgi:hypothetical protein
MKTEDIIKKLDVAISKCIEANGDNANEDNPPPSPPQQYDLIKEAATTLREIKDSLSIEK